MSKKFTSFLVLAAALLLAVPTHAQILKKAGKQQVTTLKAGPLKVNDVQKVKAAKAKANDKTVGIAFTGAMHQQVAAEATLLKAAINNIESENAAFEKLMAKNLTSTKLPVKTSVRVFDESVATPLTASASRRAEAIDENGIITAPAEGEELTYKRAGTGYYNSGGSVYIGTQSGNVTIVEATDGTVYIKDIISYYASGAWVKGTKSGNTITVPVAQPVNYNTQYTTTLSVNFGTVDAEGNIKKAEAQPEVITFAIDETNKVISLQGTAAYAQGVETTFVGVFWDDDNSFSGFGDAESVWTLKEGEEVATTGANVDALPYSNALATADDFSVFGVLDANEDGNTWQFTTSNGTYYNYSSSEVADDWLISPAIKLEAGKKYHFAIDAKAAGASYPEKFEVLLGAEAKASALTQSVLAATEVAVTEYTTYENEAVEVAETGYYHFGIHAISDADQYRLMIANFLVEAGAEPTAPAAVTDFAVAQTPDKLETVVSFKAPAKTVGGDDLTDLTKIEVLRDGKVIKSLGGAEPISWDASAQGYENAQDVAAIDFGGGFTATLDGGGNTNTPKYYTSGTALRMYAKNSMTLKGTAIKKVVFTFKDKNVLEANVGTLAIDGMTGTWTGNADEIVFTVTDGSGNQARIQKIEIEGAAAGLTPGAEYTYVDDAEDLTVGTHVYQVIPYNTSGAGVKSEEKSIFLTVAYDVPHTFDFSQNLLDLFTVIDNNGDGKTWTWSESNGAYYPYSGSNDADDYLITLPFNLKAGKRYNVVVSAKNNGFLEKFEVKAGKAATVDGLTETVIPEVVVENEEEFEDYEGVFAPTEDGQYYFAVHATSDADMYYLLLNSLTVEIAPELTAPAAVADLTATAGAEGALEANLAFTAPTKDINGDALTSGALNVKIYRDGELVNTLENVLVGAAATWKDTNVENGKIYTYYVVANNESGDGMKSEKVKVFVGEDAFGIVENIQITGTTANTISLSWDPVTGVNGGYVNAAEAKYAVVSTHVETVLFWQVFVIDEILATVTGETSTTVDYDVNAGEQEYKYFGVLAYKDDAELPAVGDEYDGDFVAALVGGPYELPFFESFTGSTLHYLWDTNATLFVNTDSSDDDGVALDLLTDEAGLVYLQSGKIKINDTANPTLILNAKSPNVGQLYVYASKDGGEFTSVAALNLTEDYQNFKVSLEDFIASGYVQFTLAAVLNTPYTADASGNLVDKGDYVTIDEIRVVDLYEYNLKATVKAPKSVVAGKSAKVLATVTNEGDNAVQGYTVTVKAGEKVITSVIGSDELAPFAKDEIEVEYETSIFDEAGDVTLTVEVEYENELYPDDNTASTIITVKEPAAVAPTSLLAEDKGKAGVDLTWTVASAGNRAADAVTEDFEDTDVFEPFGLGGITADEHSGAFGDWTLYDGNGISTYGFNGTEFPNNYAPMAFIPFNPATVSESLASSYAPHSGEQFLISFCPAEENNAPATDHWLISPELSGDAQTISFYARAITAQYGAETFEILASSTDNNPESFTIVGTENELDATEWTEITAELPAGTKYFAIRHTSTDVFGLLIDDVTYTAGNGSAPVAASFNIYYNGEKIATVEGDKTTYTVAREKVEVGTQTFGVSAVYANGAESRVTVATIEIVTGIQQIAADGKAVDIYSLDGKLIRSQATSLDGLKGFYIVNGKKVMVK